MQEYEKVVLWLLTLGGFIATGQILTGNEKVTPRLFVGRVILGAATSMAAGAVLILLPGVPLLAVVGLAAAFGVAGHQVVEIWLRRRGSQWLVGRKNHHDPQ